MPLTEEKNPARQTTGLRIIFMGTPEFAVASLNALVREGYMVIAVITAPDKPAGRGMKMNESAVKKYATEKNIPVLQPEKLKNPVFIEELRQLKADLQVVVAFRMLPEIVWNMPPLGTINVHASLLPKYRGAAPINWAIINGEKETGVTTFKLTHEIDTGNILLQRAVMIREQETAGELHDELKNVGATLLTDTLKALESGAVQEKSQEMLLSADGANAAVHAPKIFTETCRIHWDKTTSEVYNLIRGLSPFPGAFTVFEGKTLKIYSAKKEMTAPRSTPGVFETDKTTYLRFACSDGYIYANDIQLEGKKRMETAAFLRGYRFV